MEVCPVFIDETGVLSGPARLQPVYGVGALVIPETKDITESLYRRHFNFVADRKAARSRARQDALSRTEPPTLGEVDRLMRSTRHHEYKFSEVTRLNVQQYIILLDIYFAYHAVEFHSVIINRMEPGNILSLWDGDTWGSYADLARELMELRISRDVFAIADLQGKSDKSPVYLEDMLCTVPAVKGCLRATSDMSVYLQIVDVLLGCVQFDYKDANGYYDKASKRADAKRELVNFVKNRLGMESGERFLPTGESYQSWNYPSLFTVYRSN